MEKAVFNWSGGKDSSLALHRVLQSSAYEIKYLLTSVNSEYKRISMHGVREELLEMQAESIGIPLKKLLLPEMPTMEIYDNVMQENGKALKEEGIDHSIFGDIFLEDLKKYREGQLAKIPMRGVFPLWKKDTTELIHEFIDLGFKAVLVCVNEKFLDRSFAGRIIDREFLNDLPEDVDPCGENGEYHSFVFDGPVFEKPVSFTKGEVIHRNYTPVEKSDSKDTCFSNHPKNYDTGFWYCDLLPA